MAGLTPQFISFDEFYNTPFVSVGKVKDIPSITYSPRIFIEPVSVKEVIFSDPATIVYWTDGSKTVVKVMDGEEFNKEIGLAMAMAKRVCDNNRTKFKRLIDSAKIIPKRDSCE